MASNTVIANLHVRLTAITSQFTRGLGDAAKTVRSFSRVLNMDIGAAVARAGGALTGVFIKAITSIPRLVVGAIQSLLRFATVIGVTLVGAATTAAGALALLTRNSFKAIDDLRTMAVRFGVSTEAISTFAFAAGEANVELSSVASAMVKATKAIGEAAQKSGAARDALTELGLSAFELINLSVDEQFVKITAALAKVQNQTDKTRLALALFGRGGAEILPILAEDLQEAAKWAEILNLKISDFDAANVDAAGDAVARLKSAFTGVGNYLAATLAPIIKLGVDNVLNYIEQIGGVATISEMAFLGLERVGVSVVNNIGRVMGQIRRVVGSFGFTEASPASAVESFTEAVVASFRWAGVFKDTWTLVFESVRSGALSAAVAAMQLVVLTNKGLVKLTGSAMDRANLAASEAALLSLQLDQLLSKQEAVLAGDRLQSGQSELTYERQAESIKTLGASAVSVADMITLALTGAWKKIEIAATNASTISTSAFRLMAAEALMTAQALEPLVAGGRNLEAAAAAYFEPWSRGTKGIKDLTKSTTDEMQRIWERTGDQIADTFAAALFRGENALKSLLNLALDVAEQIFSAFVKKFVIDSIFTAIGFGGAAGGVSPASSVFSGASATSSFGVGATAAQSGVTIVNNFHQPVGSEDAISQAVRQGIVKERNLVGDIAQQRIGKVNGRQPRFAYGQ